MDEAKKLYNFKIRPNDIWIVTYPRSGKTHIKHTNFLLLSIFFVGTTWTQEMVWLIANDLDYATAFQQSLPTRFPFFE